MVPAALSAEYNRLMAFTYIVHYAEIGLKGHNRPDFEHQLIRNIKAQHDVTRATRFRGRITVESQAEIDLGNVFGIAWWAKATPCASELDVIGDQVIETLGERLEGIRSFAVRVKQSDRILGLNTREIEAEVGRRVQARFDLEVDLTLPDLFIYVEITRRQSFVYTRKRRGPGGLPVGSSGKLMGLFSAGIDSAVAAYLMAKRGAQIELVHFYALNDAASAHARKVGPLAERLLHFLPSIVIHYVPYHTFQLATAALPHRLQRQELVVFRRLMARVAQALARERGALGIFTGDNLGQVASQTLENLVAVDRITDLSLLRPLIAYDKQEIINLSQRIGVFDSAKQPYKDCCSIIARHPSTVAKYAQIEEIETMLGIDTLVERLIAEASSQRLASRRPSPSFVS